MRSCRPAHGRDLLRLAPLAAALALACTSAEGLTPAGGFRVAMPASGAGDHRGVAALMQALRTVGVKPQAATPLPAVSTAVTNCADDNSDGSLRSIIAAANEGDTIDLSALSCSVITLTQGAIPVVLDDLTLIGAGADKLAIDGAAADRVFVHYGSGTFRLSALTVRNGANRVSGYEVAGGACILDGGYFAMDHGVVSGCLSIGEGSYGGGILARGVTLYTSTLSGNVARGSNLNTVTASYAGGAFAYRGTAALYDSTVTGNRAEADPANTVGSYNTGGGIFADNGGYALRSTIDGNYSSGTGGGMASHSGFSITDSTISANAAKTRTGGGIFVRLIGSMRISNSTIAHNSAIKGGGIYVSGTPQSFTLQSTIVADNVASAGAADFAAANAQTISGANNLVVSVDAKITLPGDTLHGNPLLLPLAANGGPTRTHALARGSPAIDAGNNLADLATDQRGDGFPRVIGARADIGAVESAPQAASLAPVPATSAWVLCLLAGLLGGIGLRRRRGVT